MRSKHYLFMSLLTLTLSLSLVACGKSNSEDDIKIIEASDAAESKEPTERKYKDTTDEVSEIPERTQENAVEEEHEEEIDTSGILGYWSDNLGNSLQIYNDTDENGEETGDLAYSGYWISDDLYVSGIAETDNATYIKCKQTEFKSETDTTSTEDVVDTYIEPEVVTEEIVDPDTGEVTTVEVVVDPFAKDWVFDEEGKIVAWIDAEGNQQEIAESDKYMIEQFNNSVGKEETDDEEVEGYKEVEYTITRIEQDKDNNCTYMDITFSGQSFTLTRYN